jgi:hypothetical protein
VGSSHDSSVGIIVGSSHDSSVGINVGGQVGFGVGSSHDSSVGIVVGSSHDSSVGINVGGQVGFGVGHSHDSSVGIVVGSSHDSPVGWVVGARVGQCFFVGARVGQRFFVGARVGQRFFVGARVGQRFFVGANVEQSSFVGAGVGQLSFDGAVDGLLEGAHKLLLGANDTDAIGDALGTPIGSSASADLTATPSPLDDLMIVEIWSGESNSDAALRVVPWLPAITEEVKSRQLRARERKGCIVNSLLVFRRLDYLWSDTEVGYRHSWIMNQERVNERY